MTGAGAPESFDGAAITGNTFPFLGIRPLLGRAIAPDDAKPGSPPVFVLSYKVWQRRFGGDPSIVGFTLAAVVGDPNGGIDGKLISHPRCSQREINIAPVVGKNLTVHKI